MHFRLCTLLFSILIWIGFNAFVSDYRGGPQRSGHVDVSLPETLNLTWQYKLLTPPSPAWTGHNQRMKWDYAFQPIVVDDKAIFATSTDCSLYCLSLSTGKLLWRTTVGGAVRFAPSHYKGRLYFNSDDGHLYSVSLKTGKLLWKFRGGPQKSFILWQERVLSRWPGRGGVCVKDDILYTGFGIWPTEGIYIYAFDLKKHKVLWCNDMSGSIYMQQPHGGSHANSGISSQGYLVVCNNSLLVPTGRAVPAILNIADGKLLHFKFEGKYGGGDVSAMSGKDIFANNGVLFETPYERISKSTFSAVGFHKETVVGVDGNGSIAEYVIKEVEKKDRKGKSYKAKDLFKAQTVNSSLKLSPESFLMTKTHYVIGAENTIVFIDKSNKSIKRFSVEGTVYGLNAGKGSVIASTDMGIIYCFSQRSSSIKHSQTLKQLRAHPFVKKWQSLSELGESRGNVVVFGDPAAHVLSSIAQEGKYKVFGIYGNAQKHKVAQTALVQAGLYGTNIQTLPNTKKIDLPNYSANYILDLKSQLSKPELDRILKPYGGVYLHQNLTKHVIRKGIEGDSSWTHLYSDSGNSLVSKSKLTGPFSIKWFSNFDRIVLDREVQMPGPLYAEGKVFLMGLNEVICSDVFTGQQIWRYEIEGLLKFIEGDGHYAGSSTTTGRICLSEENIFILHKDRCFVLDKRSGKLVKELKTPNKKYWGYAAIHNGYLIGSEANLEHKISWQYSRGDTSQIPSESTSVFAVNCKSYKTLWSFKPVKSIRNNAIAISENKVFLIDRELSKMDSQTTRAAKWRKAVREGKEKIDHPFGTLVALDIKGGKVLWQNKKEIFGTLLLSKNNYLLMTFTPTNWTQASEVGGRVAMLDATTGKRFWDKSLGKDWGGKSRPLIFDDEFFLEPYFFDLKTGEKGRRFKRKYCCGLISAAENMFIMRSGTLSYADTETCKVENFGGVRPGCWINSIPAASMIVSIEAQQGCDCKYINKSSVGLERRSPNPVYTESDGKIKINDVDGFDVRYTTDGMPPTIESPVFPASGVKNNGQLKVKTFSVKYPPSDTVSVK